MFTYKIDEEVALRLFNEDDAEEFYQLTIQSKSYLKEWLGWLDNIKTVEDTAENIRSRLNEVVLGKLSYYMTNMWIIFFTAFWWRTGNNINLCCIPNL